MISFNNVYKYCYITDDFVHKLLINILISMIDIIIIIIIIYYYYFPRHFHIYFDFYQTVKSIYSTDNFSFLDFCTGQKLFFLILAKVTVRFIFIAARENV